MLDPAEVCRLEERRQAVGISECAAERVAVGGGWMMFLAPGSWVNQACGMGLDGPVEEAELDALVAFFESRGAEPRVELAPYAHASLTAGLARRGFVVRDFETVLARPLSPEEDPWEAQPGGRPAGVEVERLEHGDEEALERYVQVTTAAFHPDGVEEVHLESGRVSARHPRVESFLAYLDGELAGGGGVDVLGEVACLIGAATAAPFRRRGVQQALFAARAARAAELGARVLTVQSTPGGPTERNARRLGLAPAYTKVTLVRPGPGLAPVD